MKKILIALLATGLLAGCSSKASPDKKSAETAVQKVIDSLKACDVSREDMSGFSSQFKNISTKQFKEILCPFIEGIANEMKIVDVIVHDKTAIVTIEVKEFDDDLFTNTLFQLFPEHKLFSANMNEEEMQQVVMDSLKKIDVKDVLSKDTSTVIVTLSFQKGEWIITDDSGFFNLFE